MIAETFLKMSQQEFLCEEAEKGSGHVVDTTSVPEALAPGVTATVNIDTDDSSMSKEAEIEQVTDSEKLRHLEEVTHALVAQVAELREKLEEQTPPLMNHSKRKRKSGSPKQNESTRRRLKSKASNDATNDDSTTNETFVGCLVM